MASSGGRAPSPARWVLCFPGMGGVENRNLLKGAPKTRVIRHLGWLIKTPPEPQITFSFSSFGRSLAGPSWGTSPSRSPEASEGSVGRGGGPQIGARRPLSSHSAAVAGDLQPATGLGSVSSGLSTRGRAGKRKRLVRLTAARSARSLARGAPARAPPAPAPGLL